MHNCFVFLSDYVIGRLSELFTVQQSDNKYLRELVSNAVSNEVGQPVIQTESNSQTDSSRPENTEGRQEVGTK